MAEKVALISLGCPKNLVDSEMMLGHLHLSGYELTTDAADADVIVVNTCGFLGAAAQESVDALLEAAERKKGGKCRAVIAAGCMTQRFGTEAAEALPEIDGFIGVGQVQALPDVVRGALGGDRPTPLQGPSAGFEGYGLRIRSTPRWTAYVKVSEGCDRKCSFCVIPAIRGPMVSRPLPLLVSEARSLAADGAREIILIGQDPTRYGVDLRADRPGLARVLQELGRIEPLRWIRLMYLFPDRATDGLVEAIATVPKVCRYVDMPFQHASRSVVRAMNRPGDGEEYLRLLQKLRAACPDIVVRSTFIVGFPGETDSHFEELLEFIRAAELDWAGAFCYSREEGSPAAALPRQVPKRVARERYERLMLLQREITQRRNERWVGRELEVLVEAVEGDTARGRTEGQAPEIDGSVRVALGETRSQAVEGDLRAPVPPVVRPGDFVRVIAVRADGYDLDAHFSGVASPG
jgi:ribosomal protein S12 methylthiotransferase